MINTINISYNPQENIMAHNDNKDILSWKRVIQNLQDGTDEGVKAYNEAQLGLEEQGNIETEHYNVVVSSNDHGIIVDVYDKHDKQREPIKSDQYWDEDVMEGKEEVTEGTWSVPETPEQVEKLTILLKNPLNAEKALDELYDVFGDDELFDDLEVMKRNEPETDVRHVVIRRLKDMNFIKEVRESWTIPDSELASKDWGDAEKHKRTYKVIHATKGTMEVEATTSYEAAKLFAKAKGLKSTKGVDAYLADAEHVAEDSEDGASAEDLVDIITHRIKQDNNLMLKLLGDEGPDSLMNAIENVADFYSGTTEVGSSDVSAMVDAVKKQLI